MSSQRHSVFMKINDQKMYFLKLRDSPKRRVECLVVEVIGSETDDDSVWF